MDKILSNDGFVTFFNEVAGETYHPRSSVREEAVEKYVKALDVQPGKVIFDICFGLGYLTAAGLERGPMTVYCFENDEKILRKVVEGDAGFRSYGLVKDFVKGFFERKTVYEKDGTKLVMVFGDAREKIKKVDARADYVFFAPFSPAKAPDMWTTDFFRDIRMKMNAGGKLATFSYAKMVRENLQKAGFAVRDGPTVGRRSPSVIAENAAIDICKSP